MDASVSPKYLPKHDPAPAALTVELKAATAGQSGVPIPAIREIAFRLDRNVVIDLRGYPDCGADFERADLERIEALCADAIVGGGSVGFGAAPPQSAIVVNRGRRGPVRTLYLVAAAGDPSSAAIVMPTAVRAVRDGRVAREARIAVPASAAETVGQLTSLRLRLARRFGRDGRRASVISAKCPDGKLLVGIDLEFADSTTIVTESIRPCTGR